MRRGRNDIKNKQDYMGRAYIVLFCIKTKIRDLSFNIQIFLSVAGVELRVTGAGNYPVLKKFCIQFLKTLSFGEGRERLYAATF